jgi:Mn2+/Fe2+ NRAMP family transporter
MLLWVVLTANLMAMTVQYLSAKLGIVTGRTLPWPPTSPSSSARRSG